MFGQDNRGPFIQSLQNSRLGGALYAGGQSEMPPSMVLLAENLQPDSLNLVKDLAPNIRSEKGEFLTAHMIQTAFPGVSEEEALRYAQLGLQAGAIEGDTHEKSFGEALVGTAKNSWHRGLSDLSMATYMSTGLDYFLNSAQKHRGKIENIWEDFGLIGNLGLSTAGFALDAGVGAALTAAGGALLGPAGAFGVGAAYWGLRTSGALFNKLDGMVDVHGNKIDITSPEAKAINYAVILMAGPVRQLGMKAVFGGDGVVTKGTSWLFDKLGVPQATADSIMFDSIVSSVLKGGLMGGVTSGVGVAGASLFTGMTTAFAEEAVKNLEANVDLEFDRVEAGDIFKELMKNSLDAAIPAVLMGFVTGGVRAGVQGAQAKARGQAELQSLTDALRDRPPMDRPNFEMYSEDFQGALENMYTFFHDSPFRVSFGGFWRKGGVSFDTSWKPSSDLYEIPSWMYEIGDFSKYNVSLSDAAKLWASFRTQGESPSGFTPSGAPSTSPLGLPMPPTVGGPAPSGPIASGPTSPESPPAEPVTAPTMEDPVKVVIDGTRFRAVNEREEARIALAEVLGEEDVPVEVVAPEITPKVLENIAKASWGEVRGDMIVFSDEEGIDTAKALLQDIILSEKETDTSIELTVSQGDGVAIVKLSKELVDLETSLDQAEDSTNTMIREALGDLIAHTEGRVTKEDMDNNVGMIRAIAGALEIPVDTLLKEKVSFVLSPNERGALGRFHRRKINGKDTFTIYLSKQANVSTLVHESGHLVRFLLPSEKLSMFTHRYGKPGATWETDIEDRDGKYWLGEQMFGTLDEAKRVTMVAEERFADDFVRYWATGIAPTRELTGVFNAMSEALRFFIEMYGPLLDAQVKQSFDKLFQGDVTQFRQIQAYHGTGGDFTHFDPNFAGSGEGGEMHGWGTYLTTDFNVANNYRSLAYDPDQQRVNGRPILAEYDRVERSNLTNKYEIMQGLESMMLHNPRDVVLAELEESEVSQATLDYFKNAEVDTFGNVYKVSGDVNIVGEEDAVPESILNKLRGLYAGSPEMEGIVSQFRPEMPYRELYGLLAGNDQGELTSKLFADVLGIDGFSYTPEGESYENYVIFNANKLSIDSSVLFQHRVFHGSPHHFDAFSLDHVGEGEGVQAFGWGLYFTDKRSIAEWYAKHLSKDKITYHIGEGGPPIDELQEIEFLRSVFKHQVLVDLGEVGPVLFQEDVAMILAEDFESENLDFWSNYDEPIEGEPYEIIEQLKAGPFLGYYMSEDDKHYVASELSDEYTKLAMKHNQVKSTLYFEDITWTEHGERAAEELGIVANVEKSTRVLYDVTLHKGKDPSEYIYIDWQEPLSAEMVEIGEDILRAKSARGSKAVYDYLQDTTFLPENAHGYHLYNELVRITGSPKEASLTLLSAGFDGIRYPVGTISGNQKEGAYNYVIFDDSAVSIDETTLFQLPKGIQAWHGSPHKFDEFSLDHIGSGEGAQAFGWGLYFTDSQSVAKWYAERLADKRRTRYFSRQDGELVPISLEQREKLTRAYGAEYVKAWSKGRLRAEAISALAMDPSHKGWDLLGIDPKGAEGGDYPMNDLWAAIVLDDHVSMSVWEKYLYLDNHLPQTFLENEKLLDAVVDTIVDRYEASFERDVSFYAKANREIINKVAKELGVLTPHDLPSRALYNVILHGDKTVDDMVFLEWEEPISKRFLDRIRERVGTYELFSPEMFEALGFEPQVADFIIENIDLDYARGSDFYETLAAALGSSKDASLLLDKMGIDGIKYPVGTISGGRKEGAYNYVMFDAKSIEVAETTLYQKEQGLPYKYEPKEDTEIDGILYNSVTGAGAVQGQGSANIDGFTVVMRARDFLNLAPQEPIEKISRATPWQGEILAPPVMTVEWTDKGWELAEADGTLRVASVMAAKGEDALVPVNINTKGALYYTLEPHQVKAPIIGRREPYRPIFVWHGGLMVGAEHPESEILKLKESAPMITPEVFNGIQNMVVIGSDRLGAHTFDGMDGLKIEPVNFQGGVGFLELHGQDVAWAVDGEPMLNQILAMAMGDDEREGTNGYVLIRAMAPDAHRSNFQFLQGYLRLIKEAFNQRRITKKTVGVVDDIIRKHSGVKASILKGTFEEDVRDFTFEQRREISSNLAQVGVQNLGLPSYDRYLRETTEKKFGVPGARVGDGLALIRLTGDYDHNKVHPSYQYVLKGDVIGWFETPIARELVYGGLMEDTNKHTWAEIRDTVRFPAVTRVSDQLRQLGAHERTKELKGHHHAQAMLNGLLGNWELVTGKREVRDYIKEIALNEGGITLDRYNVDELHEEVKAGITRIFKLEGARTYFNLRKTDSGESLGGVISNEIYDGMLPLIMGKAIEEGADVVDAFAVRTVEYPHGLLPTLYTRYGFEVVDTYKFSMSFFKQGRSPADIRDAFAFWRSQGHQGEITSEGEQGPDVVSMALRKEFRDDRQGFLRWITSQDKASVRGGDIRGRFFGPDTDSDDDRRSDEAPERRPGLDYARPAGGDSQDYGRRSGWHRLSQIRAELERLTPLQAKSLALPSEQLQQLRDLSDETTLYQIDKIREYLNEKKPDIKKAVEEYYWIPSKVLWEYKGEPWADKELSFRNQLGKNSWILDEAKTFPNFDEFIESVQDHLATQKEKYEWLADDEEWLRRVYEYAKIEKPATRDKLFVASLTDERVIQIANRARQLSTEGQFDSPDRGVIRLTARSPKEEIDRARKVIEGNPRPFRLLFEEDPYEGLGELVDEYLREPTDFGDMDEREIASTLMDTDIHKVKIDARDRLKTYQGVKALEVEASRRLATLGAESGRTIKSLQGDLDKAKSRLADAKASIKELKAKGHRDDVEIRRLQRQKATAERNIDRLGEVIQALRDRARYKAVRQKIEKERGIIKRKVKFNPNSVHIDYKTTLDLILDAFSENPRGGAFPTIGTPFFTDRQIAMIEEGLPIEYLSLSELEDLKASINAMRKAASETLKAQKAERSAKLANMAQSVFKNIYKTEPKILSPERSDMYNLIELINTTQPIFEGGMVRGIRDSLIAAIGKMGRLTRIMDGDIEGPLYNWFTRQVYEMVSARDGRFMARMGELDAKMKKLGITKEDLYKPGYTYTRTSGQKVKLNKGQTIGVYVYAQNPLGMAKLNAVGGNDISPAEMTKLFATLTPVEKELGEYMIWAIGNDEVWGLMNTITEAVYNFTLGKRSNYFHFAMDPNYKPPNLDDQMGTQVRYVEKGFTKEIDPNATYPLDLNVFRTLTHIMRAQEHFIEFAEWQRDSNYLLTRGAVGDMIKRKFGPKMYNSLIDYVKRVGGRKDPTSDIDKVYNFVLGNLTLAKLGLNLLTVVKQIPSFGAVLRGDVGFVEFFQALGMLANPSKFAEAVEMMHRLSPSMKERQVQYEAQRFLSTDYDAKVVRVIQHFHEKYGMSLIGLADALVVTPLWLASFNTYLNRNPDKLEGDALIKEAAYRATEFIRETQPSTLEMDKNLLQGSNSPFVRATIMFSNQLMNYANMWLIDIPSSARAYSSTKNKAHLRKMFGTMFSLLLAGGMLLLFSGKLRRKKKESDEQYLERLLKEAAQTLADQSLPIVGGDVAQGIGGYSYGELLDVFRRGGALTGELLTLERDGKVMRVLKKTTPLVRGLSDLVGLPTTAGTRAIRAIENLNPLELFGPDWAEAWEDWME